MSDQNNKNAQPPSSEKEPQNAGGIDDIEEGEERVEEEDRVEEGDARHAAGGRPSDSERANAPGSHSGSERRR
jgi:hypothetical protein